jgi:hypothetical protein
LLLNCDPDDVGSVNVLATTVIATPHPWHPLGPSTVNLGRHPAAQPSGPQGHGLDDARSAPGRRARCHWGRSGALARLREDLANRKLETGHDVYAIQDAGLGEGGDVGL